MLQQIVCTLCNCKISSKCDLIVYKCQSVISNCPNKFVIERPKWWMKITVIIHDIYHIKLMCCYFRIELCQWHTNTHTEQIQYKNMAWTLKCTVQRLNNGNIKMVNSIRKDTHIPTERAREREQCQTWMKYSKMYVYLMRCVCVRACVPACSILNEIWSVSSLLRVLLRSELQEWVSEREKLWHTNGKCVKNAL